MFGDFFISKMGCCAVEAKLSQEKQVKDGIKAAIETGQNLRLKTLYKVLEKVSPNGRPCIDRAIFSDKEITLNALSYSILRNQIKSFKFITETLFPSIPYMEELLAKHNLSALDLICQKAYTEMLLLYLPLYLDHEISISSISESHNNPDLPANIYTPIQKACELGHISIISTITRFFQSETQKKAIPKALDLNYPEEITGENCALITCRTGNFTMMKYLFEIQKADFMVKNKHGENAIIVCLNGCGEGFKESFLDCLGYLVDVIGVNVREMHEEMLLIAKDRRIIEFLEGKLRDVGVNATKRQVEIENLVKPAVIPKTDLEMHLDGLGNTEFFIKNYIADDSVIMSESNTLVFSMLNENSFLVNS